MATSADRLIPGLPNEIGIYVLRQLDFFELISAYFVNGLWARQIDKDEELRLRMFRLPKRLQLPRKPKAADKDAIIAYIADLWQDVHDAVEEDETGDSEWNWVAFNPLFDNHEGGYVDDDGSIHPNRGKISDIIDLPDVPKNLHFLLHKLCGSMLVISPPIHRA